MRRRCCLLLVGALGCEAEPVDLYQPDAGVDAWGSPQCPTASIRFADGTWCEGHDEDCDGVPDRCDGCPGVADHAKPGVTIGDACRPLPFGTPWRRIHFDPFADRFAWPAISVTTSTPIAPITGADLALGGSSTSPDVAYVRLGAQLEDRVVVATAVLEMRLGYGRGGILLRVDDRGAFVGCALSLIDGLVAMQTSATCTADGCTAVDVASVFVPLDTKRPIGVRATVRVAADAPDQDELECRLFDPERAADTLARDASTGWSTRPFRFPHATRPRGAVALLAKQATVGFRWLDVLVAP